MADLDTVDDDSELSSRLQELAKKTKLFAQSSKSEATKKAYRSDFRHFRDWFERHNFSPLPAKSEAIALYFTHLADEGFAASTISRRKVAIAQAHKLNDFETPTSDDRVREVLKGIKRELGATSSSKRPLMTVEIRRIVRELDRDSVIDCRDAALLLLGFAGGLRRSELVGLDVDDIEERKEGVVIRIRGSKTDQEGEGQIIGIPNGRYDETCPVKAIEMWLGAADIEAGPVFRSVSKGGDVSDERLSGRSVASVVKRHVRSIGLEPDQYSAHSLRCGFASEAAKNGASEREIMKQTRHRSREVVRQYIKEGSVLEGNAADVLGL